MGNRKSVHVKANKGIEIVIEQKGKWVTLEFRDTGVAHLANLSVGEARGIRDAFDTHIERIEANHPPLDRD